MVGDWRGFFCCGYIILLLLLFKLLKVFYFELFGFFLFLFFVLVLFDFMICFFFYIWFIYFGFLVFWSFKGKWEGNKVIIWGVGRSREWVGFQLKGWREKNGGVILFSIVCFWCFYEVCKLQILLLLFCIIRQLQNIGGCMMFCILYGYKSYMNIFMKLMNGMVGQCICSDKRNINI